MSYYLFAHEDPTYEFDHYLGSALTFTIYWIRPARALGLPLITNMLDRVESETDPFVLSGNQVLQFREELDDIISYWIDEKDDQFGAGKERLESFRRASRILQSCYEKGLIIQVG